jgi:pterin-4a-carbinolamine dehydratase
MVSAVGILTEQQIEQELGRRPHWQRRRDRVFRELRFRDFDEATSFVCRLAQAMERRDPHVQIVLYEWNQVRLAIAHQNRAGITNTAFEIADQLDATVDAFEKTVRGWG